LDGVTEYAAGTDGQTDRLTTMTASGQQLMREGTNPQPRTTRHCRVL